MINIRMRMIKMRTEMRMRRTNDKITKQGVFRTHTKEKTGVLRAERLRDALLEVRIIFNAFENHIPSKWG